MRRLVSLGVVPLALLAWPPFAHGAVTERVNVSPSGAQANRDTYFAPGLSADGRYVVFSSAASNLGDSPGRSFVRDRVLGTTSGISPYQFTDVSADLRFVVFSAYADGLPTAGRSRCAARRTSGNRSRRRSTRSPMASGC